MSALRSSWHSFNRCPHQIDLALKARRERNISCRCDGRWEVGRRLGSTVLLITAVIKSTVGQESENSLYGFARARVVDSRLVTMRDTALYHQEAFRDLLRNANFSDRFSLQAFGDIREDVFYCYCLTTGTSRQLSHFSMYGLSD